MMPSTCFLSTVDGQLDLRASIIPGDELRAETRRLASARQLDEIACVDGDLRAPESVESAMARAEERATSVKLGEEALKQLERLALKVASLRGQLESEGTRIVVYSADGGSLVRTISARSTIEVPGLGVLEIKPARPGLALAAANARATRAQLEVALLCLGVTDVHTAREEHAIRSEAEIEDTVFEERKKKLAPHGLEALAQAVVAARADQMRLEAALDEAMRADREREESLRELAGNRLNEEAFDGLRHEERSVALLRATCDAIGMQVQLYALADLRFRAGSAQMPEELTSGNNATLTLTMATSLVFEDIVEIRLEPRSEDLARARTKLTRAEHELAASLQALEVGSIAEATERARVWARLDTTRKGAEDRLAVAAPRGLENLRAEVEQSRERARVAEQTYVEAKRAYENHAPIKLELAQNRITVEVLTRLERLERALHESETEVERLQAHVRAISGPVAEGHQRAWTASEAMRPASVANLVWEIIPGELGSTSKSTVNRMAAIQRINESSWRTLPTSL